jgi:hypothetical protein
LILGWFFPAARLGPKALADKHVAMSAMSGWGLIPFGYIVGWCVA